MKRETNVRKQIKELLTHCEKPLSVPEINEHIRVNKTTLYRQIISMVEEGLLSQFDFGDGTMRYESTTNGHHHHIVCLKCKKIEGIELGDDFTKEEQYILAKNHFMVTSHALEFFGICESCQRNERTYIQ